MGEIKSTLDLVMEKTRHLTLSEEEKQQQSRDAEKRRFNGLLQKYTDGLLSIEQLKEPLQALRAGAAAAGDWMRADLYRRIDLDQDNTPWLAILEDIFGLDGSDLEAVFEEYRSALAAAEKQRSSDVREFLAMTYRIAGSAVLPNLETDPQWISERDDVRACFREMLDRLTTPEASATRSKEGGLDFRP